MKNVRHLPLILSLLCFVFFGCKETNNSMDSSDGISDMNARTYFSAYTQGMILDSDPIEFRFLEAQNIDQNDLKKAIRISPDFEFTLQFQPGDKTFKIIPDQKLKRGESYEVKLLLHNIFRGAKAKSIVSKIKVFEQFVSVQREGLVIDDQNNSHIQLNVTTALDEDKEKVKRLFDFPDSRIQIEAITEKEFTIKLNFTPGEGTTQVHWNGSAIGSKEKGAINVWNYDEDEFNVVNTYFDRAENEFNIYFTKLLDEDQDAKGLIRIGNKDAEYQIINNQIKALVKSNTNENINLAISKGIKSKDGKKLAIDLSYEIELSIVKPDIQWLADGSYIPVSGKFRIPFKAKALQSVVVRVVGIKSENASRYAAWNSMNYMDQTEMIRFGNLVYKSSFNLAEGTSKNLEEWNEFGIDITDAFQREKGTIYYVQLSYGPSNTILSCDDQSIYEFEKETVEPDWFENRYRRYQYYNYYDYSQQENPCHVSYYLARTNIAKLIHCTNIFPIIKKGEKDVHIAVKEIASQKLAKGAKVDLISLQGLEIGSSEVGNNGICVFRNLQRQARAIRISYAGEISYFNMEDGEANPLTEFDVSSDVRDIDNRIFVYTDRDVRRPGDTIYMDIMLNRAKFQFEEGLPILIKLKNPKNVLYNATILPIKNGQSIYTFKMSTELDSPTGYWKADIQIGPLQKIKTLRVETIKPNVVDLIYHFQNEDESWIYSNKISGNLDVNYLAGYAMRNGKVSASANILPVNSPFKAYKNFAFQPSKRPDPVKDVKVWAIQTDQVGKASFKFSQDFKQYLGVSRFVIDSKIDLPGGGLNTETESRLISPFNSYVGIEKSKGQGWRGSYRYGETPAMDLIRLDNKGKLIAKNSQIQIELFKYENDWWYDRYRLTRGHRSHSSQRFTRVWEKKITMDKGKFQYIHDTKLHESGMYKLRVTDPNSGHMAEHEFHSIVNSNYFVQSNPVFIDLSLAKENYTVGEFLELKLPEINEAKALISIERGEEVMELFWYDLSDSSLKIPVQEDWFPNVYVHVSIVQNYGQMNNDRPMRMYTVKKILVNQPKNLLEPIVLAKGKIEPNKEFSFEVKEQGGQAMEYTVALVDMGLLNLTGFETPDPHSHFSKLMALRVKTWDIFQQLIFYMNPSFAGVFSIGGDEAAEKLLDESADFNRFVPVVFHLGSFQLSPNKKNKHSIDIPNYIGSLRLMLVACNDRSFGSTDKSIKVISPLMIQSQLPRSLNITDKVDVPITFFKDESRIKQVNLTTKTSNDLLKFEQTGLSTSLTGSDQAIETLSFTTGLEAGNTDITFQAKSAGFEAFEETKLYINYPNSYADKQE
ncbi:MAG: hypothetical protein HKN67_09810, partial [Saprospiraceae bacterium]|nr:hypothetical protein [Saprospiraceae bacterium]